MREEWEINRVSTPEHIFDKINEEMARPVGILVIGADCEFKSRKVEELSESIDDSICAFSYATSARDFSDWFDAGNNVIVTLTADDSCNRMVRKGLVRALKNVGAETVVGICIEPRGSLADGGSEIIRQALLKCSPATSEFDYRIVISEEDEE